LKNLQYSILSEPENMRLLKKIVVKSTYIHPRLHSSLPLLIREIYHPSLGLSQKQRVKVVKQISEEIFEECFFNETVYSGLKSATRPKFLHIGLKFWELLGLETVRREEDDATKTKVLQILLSQGFLRVFVRSLSMQKGVLYEVAKQVKQALIKMMEQAHVKSDFAI
jgi:hypothetical protein